MNVKTDPRANSHQTIDVNITDAILTPLTCASLINEIIKYLIYQKSQIPYTYNWLKTIIDKRRKRTVDDDGNKTAKNFTIHNHFRVVSTAYDTLDDLMRNLSNEFTNGTCNIREVLIVFGTTPQCPKEIYTIKIGSLARGHVERNHATEFGKNLGKILRNIFLSQSWVDSVNNASSLPCTNTYIFLKKAGAPTNNTESSTTNLFISSQPLVISSRVKQTTINLIRCDDEKTHSSISCCGNLTIFEDNAIEESGMIATKVDESNETATTIVEHNNDDGEFCWCQFRLRFQGFKDCFINKVSVTELW